MDNLLQKIAEAVAFLSSKASLKPEACIILGSGLGGLVSAITVEATIPYKSIPHFPVSTVIGHEGNLIFGKISGKPVVVMQGRSHYYEGYTMQQVTFPVRVMKALGVKTIFLTNAAGGVNPGFHIGDLMIIKNHINLASDNPLRGKNYDELGSRFPDQHHVYDKNLIKNGLDIAKQHNIICHSGVYVGVNGPNFETRAEYRYLRIIGGDAVGMSTVPEAIVANHSGLSTFGISVITDEGNAEKPVESSHIKVLEAAVVAGQKLFVIIKELIALL
jgi:purine-nucleoside phosphorylase